MRVIYSLVARQGVVLIDYSSVSGNFPLLSLQVLRKVDASRPFRQCLIHRYAFYTYLYQGFAFLVLVEASYEARIAIKFLIQVQEMFFKMFDKATRNEAPAHSLIDFKPVLKHLMQKYENREEVDKISKLNRDIGLVEKEALCNMDRVIERGDKLFVIVQKSRQMEGMSYDIQEISSKTKRKIWWRRNCTKVTITVIMLIVIAVIVVFIVLS